MIREVRIVALVIMLTCVVLQLDTAAQTKKEVDYNTHLWLSINSTYRFSKRWGILADFHNRTSFAFKDPRFYFLRMGANYWINNRTTAAAGYAHTWFSPSRPGWNTWANENRIYQQFQFITAPGKIQILQRLRNEQRWIEKIENDQRTGDVRFVNRVRYLLSFNFSVFKKPGMPSLVTSNEVLLNFGPDIVYNTMDQNRLFIGIRQTLNSHLSFDFGYMNVYQQKSSGFQYDMNNTIRLFFYYNGGWHGETRHTTNSGADE